MIILVRVAERRYRLYEAGHPASLAGQPSPDQCPSPEGRRIRLVCPRRFFASMRLSTEERDGRVARRGGGGAATASATRATSRSCAARRFCSWARCSEAVTVSTPSTSRLPSRCTARVFSDSGSAALASRFQRSSTRESAVLTDCPPGPPERENRQL